LIELLTQLKLAHQQQAPPPTHRTMQRFIVQGVACGDTENSAVLNCVDGVTQIHINLVEVTPLKQAIWDLRT
jgi:hypothetical protein